MSKSELINVAGTVIGLQIKQVESAINAVFDTIADVMEKKEKIFILL